MEYLIAIVKIPFRIIAYLFQHPKLAIIGVIAVFLILGVRACTSTFGGNNQPANAQQVSVVPVYAQLPSIPDIKQAPYLLTTDTRVYYVERFTDSNIGLFTLHGYWTYDSKTWVKHNEDLPINKKLYPGARLINRSTNGVLVSF